MAAKKKATGGRLNRSEVVSVRLDPRVHFGAELAGVGAGDLLLDPGEFLVAGFEDGELRVAVAPLLELVDRSPGRVESGVLFGPRPAGGRVDRGAVPVGQVLVRRVAARAGAVALPAEDPAPAEVRPDRPIRVRLLPPP